MKAFQQERGLSHPQIRRSATHISLAVNRNYHFLLPNHSALSRELIATPKDCILVRAPSSGTDVVVRLSVPLMAARLKAVNDAGRWLRRMRPCRGIFSVCVMPAASVAILNFSSIPAIRESSLLEEFHFTRQPMVPFSPCQTEGFCPSTASTHVHLIPHRFRSQRGSVQCGPRPEYLSQRLPHLVSVPSMPKFHRRFCRRTD